MNVRALGALAALVLIAWRGPRPRTPLPLVLLALLALPHEHWLLGHDPWLKELAARAAASALAIVGLPIEMQAGADPELVCAHASVRVTSLCAGFETLLPLATLGAVIAALFLPGVTQQIMFILLAVVGGFGANVLRIALSARAAYYLPPASDGWQTMHDVIGYALFMVTYALLVVAALWLRSWRSTSTKPRGTAAATDATASSHRQALGS